MTTQQTTQNGEKRNRDDEAGENGVANGADGSKNPKKAKKELVTVSSTRHDSKVNEILMGVCVQAG